MTTVATPPLDPTRGKAPRSWQLMATVFGALVLLAVVLRIVDPVRFPWASNFLLVFNALLIEATPFILIGALVSAP
jgi:hypothetical protein